MGKRPPPRRVTIDGTDLVILPADEYDLLAAARRQVGGQSNRVRMLRHELDQAQRLLADAAALLREAPPSDDPPYTVRLTVWHTRCATALKAPEAPE